MKGKGVRKRPMPIKDMQSIDLPFKIKYMYNDIQVSVAYVFIQGIMELVNLF